MNNFIDTLNATSRPVVVFGASAIGKIVLDLLDIIKTRPVCFCDNDTHKQRETFYGYEVIAFETLCRVHPDALVVIAAERYFKDIDRQLSGAGFQDVFSDADVIRSIDFSQVPQSKIEKIHWRLAKLGKVAGIREVPTGGLDIPRLNVVVTSRCTLRCEHCSSLIPHYEKPSDLDASKIIAALDRLLACADLVYHVELLGGEPFLNQSLPRITKHLLDSGKILHIDVITNGTLLPPDRVLESVKHKLVSVVIDDYGKLSKKMDSLSDALKRLGIDFRVNKHWAWADLGGFESRSLSEEQLEEIFAKCNFNSCTELLDGKLNRCPRSSHGTKTGLVPEYSGDFIDILDLSISDDILKEKLRAFLHDKKFIRACNHCNGNTRDSLTLSPAEQKT